MTLRELVTLIPDHALDTGLTDADGLIEAFPGDADRPIVAPYVSVDYVAHKPETEVREFTKKDELKSHVESPAGLSNPFTSAVFCFEQAKYLPYGAWYRNKIGGRILFVKAEQLEKGDDQLFADVPGFHISWRQVQ